MAGDAAFPSGVVTFLFTDVEGSTAAWQADPERMRAAMARHDQLLTEAVTRHGGVVFKHVGDAVMAAFASPRSAVLAAAAGQRALAGPDQKDQGDQLSVRMVLHAGEAVPGTTGDYQQVPSLNRLSRLLSAAHGGQILATDAVRRLLADDVPAALELRDLGEHRLRDLLERERVWQLAGEGLRE